MRRVESRYAAAANCLAGLTSSPQLRDVRWGDGKSTEHCSLPFPTQAQKNIVQQCMYPCPTLQSLPNSVHSLSLPHSYKEKKGNEKSSAVPVSFAHHTTQGLGGGGVAMGDMLLNSNHGLPQCLSDVVKKVEPLRPL